MGVVGEGTAEQLLPESYIYYNVDIRTADKKNFQAVVDEINKELNIHELDTSYNIVYLNALGISYTANSEGANDKGSLYDSRRDISGYFEFCWLLVL